MNMCECTSKDRKSMILPFFSAFFDSNLTVF